MGNMSIVRVGGVCAVLAGAYFVLKQYEQILEALNRYVGDLSVPRIMGLRAIAFKKLGDNEKSDAELDHLIKRSQETSGGSPSFYTAMVYASRGETELAFQWLENLLKTMR